MGQRRSSLLNVNSMHDLQPCGSWENYYIQIPNHWGSKKPVWAMRFIPVDLKNFTIDFQSLAAEHWEGRATVLFVMKDGTPGTKVQAYVKEQPR